MNIQQHVMFFYCISIFSWDPIQFVNQEKKEKKKCNETRLSSIKIVKKLFKLDYSF